MGNPLVREHGAAVASDVGQPPPATGLRESTPSGASPEPSEGKAVPEGPSSTKWGNYLVISVGNHISGEVTNVGVVKFDGHGVRCGERVSGLDRAIRRGDWPESDRGFDLKRYAAMYQTLPEYRRHMDGMGHCMSIIQFRGPYPVRADVPVGNIYGMLVSV